MSVSKRAGSAAALLALAALVGCNHQAAPAGVSMETRLTRHAWETPHSEGEQLVSRHYRIFSSARRSQLRKCFPGFMEAAHANYLRLTGLTPPDRTEPMPIYLLGSRTEWAALTRSVIGPNAGTYLAIQNGGYCYRGVCVFWDIGGSAVLSVAAHEGLHQFLHHRLRDRLPMWLEEGLCVSAEGFRIEGDYVTFTPRRNPARFTDMREAIVQDRWMPMRKLLPLDAGHVVGQTPGRAVAYYGQLWTLVMFLHADDRYRAGLERMLADADTGRFHQALKLPRAAVAQLRRRGRIYNQTVSEPLFRYYITEDLDTFDREFLAFAQKFARLR